MTLHAKVKARLAELDMTFAELSKLCGLSQPYLSQIIKGQRRLSAKHIAEMSKHLQVPESFFFIDDLTKRLFMNRADYHKAIAEELIRAQSEVIFITPSRYTSAEELSQQEILKAKEKIVKKVNRYMGIVPQDPSRLKSAHELIESGIDIRLHREVLDTDLTFTIIDRRTVVIGTPIQIGDLSSRGFVAHSSVLIKLLLEYFDELWISATNFRDYAKKVISDMRKAGLSEETITERIGFSPSELEGKV